MSDIENAIIRRKSRKVKVGNIYIGGDAPIAIQSMANTDTKDVDATCRQIDELTEAGVNVVRLAVIDSEAADALGQIKKRVKVPVVADIHFDYKLALQCIENGVDKIRINPGNIGDIERVKKVVEKAKEREIPIRIGVNAGSLEKELLAKYGHVTKEALIESALKHVKILESLDFRDIVISIKASNVPLNVAAYQMLAGMVDYPLHLGVTEAGTPSSGIVKSALGIGSLLNQGIGDTIRVSLTGNPVLEVETARHILNSLYLLEDTPELISCPTCGRTKIDLIPLAEAVEKRLKTVRKKIKVAVMGCIVNGPGEAREADIGIAGGVNSALLFKKGEVIKKLPGDQILDALFEEIDKM